VFMLVTPQSRKELYFRINAFVDDTLNRSGPGKGDTNDDANTLMRETARFQAAQHLDAMARMLQGPPAES
jgi:hypothetical protein